MANGHPLLIDAALAVTLLAASTWWLVVSPYAGWKGGLFQAALCLPLIWRRSQPVAVFGVVAVVGVVQWLAGPPLAADAAFLVAAYSVAVHQPRYRTLQAAVLLELGAILAAAQWNPADTVPRSLLFLTAMVVASLCAGLTVRSGSAYLEWLAERSRRLEIERDQQASIAAAEERNRIAREIHDIVAHSLAVLVTLADAASLVNRSDPDRAEDAMRHVAEVGRQALADMRSVIGVLRTESAAADLVPQPGLGELESLLSRVRSTGLAVTFDVGGVPFPVGPATELSVYRIVQESLTNTMKHASASRVAVHLDYDAPVIRVAVTDDGRGTSAAGGGAPPRSPRGTGRVPTEVAEGGHGIAGMKERAGLHGGWLEAEATEQGWTVTATLRPEARSGAQ